MPPHDTYIEPFLGGGAIMRLKRPARHNLGMDLSGSAIAAFDGEGLPGANAGNSEAVPGAPSPLAESSDATRSESFIDISADAARSGDGGHPAASTSEFGDGRLRLECRDGLEYLETLSAKPAMEYSTLIYCDPPYLMSTRSGRRIYEHEFSSSQHRRLLRCLPDLRCMVMISGYWSEMYAEALQGWSSIQFEAMTRGGHTATEWLWFNFPAPIELHDYRYLGRDFRERERIKRKKQRWAARLARMPDLEMQSLFSAMEEAKSGRRPFGPRPPGESQPAEASPESSRR